GLANGLATGLATTDYRLPTIDYLDRFFFRVVAAVRAPVRRNPERAHLAIQIAALHAQHLRRAGDVPLLQGQLPENVLTLELIARGVQRHRRRRRVLRRGPGDRGP